MLRQPCVLALIVMLAGLFSCHSEQRVRDPSSTSSGPVEQFFEQADGLLWEQICQAVWECSPYDFDMYYLEFIVRFPSLEACKASPNRYVKRRWLDSEAMKELPAQYSNAVASGRVRFNDAQARTCLQQWAQEIRDNVSCAAYEGWPSVCRSVFEGVTQEGEGCAQSFECAGGGRCNRCDDNGRNCTACGVCTAGFGGNDEDENPDDDDDRGERCGSVTCAPDERCTEVFEATPRCLRLYVLKEGAACSYGEECKSGLCESGKCVSGYKPVSFRGDACWGLCGPGLVCLGRVDDREGTCELPRKRGEACSATTNCEADLECERASGQASGTCQRLRRRTGEQACEEDVQCASFRCYDGRCTLPYPYEPGPECELD
jgi:hypothetical protein